MKPYRELPREELLVMANRTLIEFGDLAEVHFKFTCDHCGERCEFQQPNVLFENGECHKCGKTTVVRKGGFALVMRLS